jgi:hypothetical protein
MNVLLLSTAGRCVWQVAGRSRGRRNESTRREPRRAVSVRPKRQRLSDHQPMQAVAQGIFARAWSVQAPRFAWLLGGRRRRPDRGPRLSAFPALHPIPTVTAELEKLATAAYEALGVKIRSAPAPSERQRMTLSSRALCRADRPPRHTFAASSTDSPRQLIATRPSRSARDGRGRPRQVAGQDALQLLGQLQTQPADAAPAGRLGCAQLDRERENVAAQVAHQVGGTLTLGLPVDADVHVEPANRDLREGVVVGGGRWKVRSSRCSRRRSGRRRRPPARPDHQRTAAAVRAGRPPRRRRGPGRATAAADAGARGGAHAARPVCSLASSRSTVPFSWVICRSLAAICWRSTSTRAVRSSSRPASRAAPASNWRTCS